MGFAVFSLGLIVAIIGAAKPAVESGAWPDTSWVFWAGAVVAGIGCYLWRQSVKGSTGSGDSAVAASTHSVTELLKHFGEHLEEFKKAYKQWDAEKLHDEAESFMDKFIVPVVDKRYELINQFGMSKGAEVILEFSRGERYFNRMHTAALDGHLPEAHAAFPKAVEAFDAAVAKL